MRINDFPSALFDCRIVPRCGIDVTRQA